MKRFLIFLFILFINFIFANEKTFIREYTYSILQNETKESARRIAMYEMKRILLEEVGVYIQSELIIKDSESKIGKKTIIKEFAENKIISITAGIVKVEVLDEKWIKKRNRNQLKLRAKITLDPDDVTKQIEKIINNKSLIEKLELANEKAIKDHNQIISLKEQLSATVSKVEELKLYKELNLKTKRLEANKFFEHAYISYLNEDNKTQLFLLEKVIELDSENYMAYNNAGYLHKENENYVKAIEYFKKAIGLKNDIPEPYYNIGLTYHDLGDFVKAKLWYHKAIDINPDFNLTYINLGHIYFDEGDFYKATLQYITSLELSNFSDPKAYKGLGDVSFEVGKYRQALDAYISRKEIQPNSPDVYYDIAYTYFRGLNNTNKAIKFFEKVIDLDSTYAEAHFQLGMLYLDENKIKKSKEFIRRSIDLRPDYPNGYGALGLVSLADNNTVEAIKFFEESISLDPSYLNAYCYLSYAYLEIDPEKGSKYYEKAKKLGMNCPDLEL